MPSWLATFPAVNRPKPGSFGAIFDTLSTDINVAKPVLVGTATTNIYVLVPSKVLYVAGATVQGQTVFTGSGAVTATLFKSSGGSATALTAAYDLTATLTNNYADIPITGTDVQCTLNTSITTVPQGGDTLYWSIIAAGTFGPTTADLKLGVGIVIEQ